MKAATFMEWATVALANILHWLAPLMKWISAVSVSAKAFQVTLMGFTLTTAIIFFIVLGALCLLPILYVAIVYFFDMRGKDITDI